MRRSLIICSIIFYCIPMQAQDYDTKKMRYIEQFKYWAMDEQIRTGVPAAISLAQGILETGSGTSELCTQANNHFGIKCKREWTGETFLHDDDRRHECFRKYKSAKDSYIDHSNFLKDRAHYRFLFDLEATDYQAWCKGLRKAGYATNPKYAVRLIQLIEQYNLQQYTYEAIELSKIDEPVIAEVIPEKDKVEEKVTPPEVVNVAPKTTSMSPKVKHVYDKLISKNGRNGFWARKGAYLLTEAVHYNIRYAKLLAINDLEDEPLYDDMFIYLKRKAKKGPRMFHRVKEGESMHSISQNAGVQLKYLYIYNNLYVGEEPAVGEKIYLQAKSMKTPRLRGMVLENNVAKEKVNKTTAKVEPKTVVKEKVEPKEKVVIKKSKAVEKIDFSKQNEIVEPKKRVEVVKADKKLETELKKRTVPKTVPKTVIEVSKKETPAKEVKVVESKPSNAIKTTLNGQKGSSSPIIDLEKARKVEALMGDGKKEIERLYEINERALKEKKIIPEPQSNNENFIQEKATKTKSKKENNKRTYDDKNVSDDVKNLKKKFDNLIYEED